MTKYRAQVNGDTIAFFDVDTNEMVLNGHGPGCGALTDSRFPPESLNLYAACIAADGKMMTFWANRLVQVSAGEQMMDVLREYLRCFVSRI